MSASQPQRMTSGPLDTLQPESAPTEVQFVLRRPGGQAYVMVFNETGKQIAFEEMAWKDNAWRFGLSLKPGTYRYRYYVSDGGSTAYFSPADADRVGRRTRMEGIDGLFDVLPSHHRVPHMPRDFEQFTQALRPGICSVPFSCEGAFF